MIPCPTASNDPAQRLRVPIVIAVAVTGPGCIAPDIEMINTWIKKSANAIAYPDYSPIILTSARFFRLPSNSP